MDTRLDREKAFHDEKFVHTFTTNRTLRRMRHGVTGIPLMEMNRIMRQRCRGSVVLDYGCGVGRAAARYVEYGALEVVGIDLSETAVRQATSFAAERGYSQVRFQQMNAESLDFADNTFDVVCGFGILHHLNIPIALGELARVLKPGGTAVFLEPLGHNPAINLFRRLTPGIRTVDEHPLVMSDFKAFRQYFHEVDAHFYNLTTLATVPIDGMYGHEPLLKACAWLDTRLFRLVPFIRRYAWNTVFVLTRPIKDAR